MTSTDAGVLFSVRRHVSPVQIPRACRECWSPRSACVRHALRELHDLGHLDDPLQDGAECADEFPCKRWAEEDCLLVLLRPESL
eukprot:349922-Hanusia_phi.AAC.1